MYIPKSRKRKLIFWLIGSAIYVGISLVSVLALASTKGTEPMSMIGFMVTFPISIISFGIVFTERDPSVVSIILIQLAHLLFLWFILFNFIVPKPWTDPRKDRP